MNQPLSLVECPRDAMQGWKAFIPTNLKIAYLNALLRVGFDTLDFGSFVSAKAIPQLQDTREVLAGLNVAGSATKLLAIVANVRGAEEAVAFDAIHYLGFPFSISPTFQQRNTNSTPEESLERVEAIQALCLRHNKTLVVYLSMGFGNPYGDPYDASILLQWASEMANRGITVLSLADTVGMATPEQIRFALGTLIPQYPQTTIGVHLHASPGNWRDKLEAALDVGCTRIDGALKGIGGCPMAGDALVGNLDTLNVLSLLAERGQSPMLDQEALRESLALADRIFQ